MTILSEEEIGSKIPELNRRITELHPLVHDYNDGIDYHWAYLETRDLRAQIRILSWILNGDVTADV